MSGMHIAGIGTAAASRVPVEALATVGADAAGLRAAVGLQARHAPSHDVAPVQLAVDASRSALQTAGVAATELDVIVQVGRMRIEYFTWGLSLAVAKELGHLTTRCLDVTEFTGPSLVAGIRLLDAKFRVDDRLHNALVVFPHRFSDFVDVEDYAGRWLWPLGDGAGALVVRRGDGVGTPLGHAFASDGTAGRAIGLRTEVVDDGISPDDFFSHEWALAKYYFLRDPVGWPHQFEQRAAERLAETLDLASQRAGLRLADLAVVQTGFLYPGVEQRLRERLSLGRLHVHNAHGLMGGAEIAFVLQELTREQGLRGTNVALAGFGLPASFGAIIVAL